MFFKNLSKKNDNLLINVIFMSFMSFLILLSYFLGMSSLPETIFWFIVALLTIPYESGTNNKDKLGG